MFVIRPDTEDFVQFQDEAADAKVAYERARFAYEKKQSMCVRDAIEAKKKTKEIECAKVLGNDDSDLAELNRLREDILEKLGELKKADGRVKLWDAKLQLYKNDSFYQGKSSFASSAKEGD